LSVEAVHERSTELAEEAVAFKVAGGIGATMSPALAWVTVIVAVAVMLAESRTVTVMMLSPEARSMASAYQLVVPKLTP